MSEVISSQLIGRWVTDPTDKEAVNQFGLTTLVFTDNGELRYIIHAEGKDQIMLLTYRIDNSTLVTNQPSDPREERTDFSFTLDGKLVLDYRGTKGRYVRDTAR
jgi:hypothetical protein